MEETRTPADPARESRRLRCATLSFSDIGQAAANAVGGMPFAWLDVLCYQGVQAFELATDSALADAIRLLTVFVVERRIVVPAELDENFEKWMRITSSDLRLHAVLTPHAGQNLARQLRELKWDDGDFRELARAYALPRSFGKEFAEAMSILVRCSTVAAEATVGKTVLLTY